MASSYRDAKRTITITAMKAAKATESSARVIADAFDPMRDIRLVEDGR
jgi:hypothetical protein